MQALLILPPFGGLDRPSLGIHTVQAFSRRNGHSVDVFYSNIAFASHLGEIAYMVITTFGVLELLGERIMGLPLGVKLPETMLDRVNREIRRAAEIRGLHSDPLSVSSILAATVRWLDDVSATVRRKPYDVIGFSTTFEQTNGVAILAKACRRVRPDVTLVVGGANCEGPMAPAIKSYISEIDVVFSGESETAFADYLDEPGRYAGQSIIVSPPQSDLNDMPPLDYSEFFEQLDTHLPNSILRQAGDLKISFETSRGCWWGQKHHCTFCGLNGSGIGYREKSPEKVISELTALVQATGVRKVDMTDNIMPHSYFGTLIPLLAENGLGLEIFYEQKANISLEKMISLRAAGVWRVQPGIEALQDDLLRLMKKGTSGKQNVALLRYARAVNMLLDWNLLSGFPGDREEWYAEVHRLLPLLVHLQPPTGFYTLNFDRFSPYFENPERYGVRNLRPAPAYAEVFPECEDLDGLSYHFQAESSGLTVETSAVLRSLDEAVDAWRRRWADGKTPPCLEVVEVAEDTFMLIDSRELPGTLFMQQISTEQASVALTFHQGTNAMTQWGVEQSVCVESKDGYFPLACASPGLIQRFERVRAPDLADAPV